MAFDIEFVNHASVLIRAGDTGLLTDPWYRGDVFHKGWNLLCETDDDQVAKLLVKVTHIWVSHEHPDHFSPLFFRSHGAQIRAQGIIILFQKIEDQRVVDFLRENDLPFQELSFEQPYRLGDAMSVTCLKDGFYDSALSIQAGGYHILNLNDCAVSTTARAEEIYSITGPCDVLLTQFSYAAWKGGKENKAWRTEAAGQKLNSMAVQAEVFKSKIVVPFASFVFFSNHRNFYLNDAVNTPEDVFRKFADAKFEVAVMKPGDHINIEVPKGQSDRAIGYWREFYEGMTSRALLGYAPVTAEVLSTEFESYIARVYRNNARWFIRLTSRFSPVRVFQPVSIYLGDLEQGFEVDIAAGRFAPHTGDPDLAMDSESLSFLFRNTFGFDTLAVNGCFEECRAGGFAKAAKSLAIENLNNLGLSFAPAILLERKILGVFFGHLKAVRRRLARAKP